MENNLKIAAAQFSPVRGDVKENMQRHLKLIHSAVEENVDIIIFPELSLTGYEPDLAMELAFSEKDERLEPLKKLAWEYGITIIVGAPISLEKGKPYVGLFVVSPDKETFYYCKMHLHEGEEKYFSRGKAKCLIEIKGFKLGLAICADYSVESHIKSLKVDGADYYLCSCLITANGYDSDIGKLRDYSIKYNTNIVVANFINNSGGWDTTGKSIIIDSEGCTISTASTQDTCTVSAIFA